MSHLNPGLISAYNSLTDKHLAGYFSNTRIRRHLQTAGLITRSGRIIPDKEYRHKLIQREHQRYVRECLAQAIFHKVLEMERLHQIEIKRKLEEFARRERVHKIKVERSKRYEEDFTRILSPRPPTGGRGIRKQHSGPEGEHSESSESPSSSRPNTAPGKMQRPVRLKPIHSNSTTASVRRSSPYRLLDSSRENDPLFNSTMDKESRRRLTRMEASHGISPYCLPVINNFVTPVPPATRRKDRGVKVTRSSTIRGRRLHLTTASSGADETPTLRSSVHQSRVAVNMVYFGKSVHLSHDLMDLRDEVRVFQQHCGGENLCVYKGRLHEGEMFQFISRRHRGFPFSLTFFVNGLQVERLSSCCEFKHRKGSRLGSRHGHFGFVGVEGASPCYKCIIAMGLDKKPTPPPRRVKEDLRSEESIISPKDAPEIEMERVVEDAASHSECDTTQPQDTETRVKEEMPPQENKVRDDYEEDFEADDEGPPDDARQEPHSPAAETEQQLKEKDANESEDDEKDEDTKSHSGSSSHGSDQEESDAEDTKEPKEDEKTEEPKEVTEEETTASPTEKNKLRPEEAAHTEDKCTAPSDSNMLDSAGDSTEIEISDTSMPLGDNNRSSEDTSGEKDEEIMAEEEQERAKSVQEKLAEAILKESQCSSEPELSDTSTEEEEESTDKNPKQEKEDEIPEKLITFTERQQTSSEEIKCEEGDTGGDESTQKHQVLADEQEPHENSESIKDEKIKEAEEDAKEETTAEKGERDVTEDKGELHPVSEESVTQDDKAAEPPEEAPTENPNAEATVIDEENQEETGPETDIHYEEMGQVAKSEELDESSVSEPNKNTDETAVPDNAEEVAMTGDETMEIKVEPSEERGALSREEAPVTDTEEPLQVESGGGAAASETGVTAEGSNSSPRGSFDTAVEKAADSEESPKVESSEGGIKEEAEQIPGTEGSKGQNEEDEKTDTSAEKDEKEGNRKTEEHVKEVDKETDEKDNENTDGEETDKTGQCKDETKADEVMNKKENIAKGAADDDDANTERKENEEMEKTLGEEDKAVTEEEVEGKAEEDEKSETVKNKDEEEPANKSNNEGEERNAVEEENDERENKMEPDEVVESEKGDGGEEKKEAEEELEKSVHSNTAESPDVSVGEATSGTKAEAVQNTMGEAENVEEETENGKIDAENGEISPGAEGRSHEHEEEGPTMEKNDSKTAEDGAQEREPEEPFDESRGVKEPGGENCGDDKHDETPNTDETKNDGKDRDDSEENSAKDNMAPETSGTEIKEELKSDNKKESEETQQDENGNNSDVDNDKDTDLGEANIPKDDEVVVASSGNQEQSSAPVTVDFDDASSKLEEEKGDFAVKSEPDKHLHPNETTAAVDLLIAKAENGADMEEASKASEEGASVLLKPHDEADNMEHRVTAGKETPEALAREDSTDMVTNWVNAHRSSKFFETFIEPLDNLREEISDFSSNKEKTQTTEMQRLASTLEMVRVSEDEGKVIKDENDEAVEATGKWSEEDPAKERAQEEKTDVRGFIKMTDSEQGDKESANSLNTRLKEVRGSSGSLKEAAPTQGTENLQTEVENASIVHQPPADENHTEEESIVSDPNLNLQKTATEEHHKSMSAFEQKDSEESWEKPDEDRKDVQLIRDIQHTLSKDRLSTFSVVAVLILY
ncbi:glutamate-rich protein 3 [Pholidichthys leucotaenia]